MVPSRLNSRWGFINPGLTLVGNEGMIHWLTMNNHPSNPHSHPFRIVEMKPYCSEQANEATRTFSIGAIATAEDLRLGH